MKPYVWKQNSTSLLKKYELDSEKIRAIVKTRVKISIPAMVPIVVSVPIITTQKPPRVIKKRDKNQAPSYHRRRSNASVYSIAKSDWTPEDITYFKNIGIKRY